MSVPHPHGTAAPGLGWPTDDPTSAPAPGLGWPDVPDAPAATTTIEEHA